MSSVADCCRLHVEWRVLSSELLVTANDRPEPVFPQQNESRRICRLCSTEHPGHWPTAMFDWCSQEESLSGSHLKGCLLELRSAYRKKTADELKEYKASRARNSYNKKKLELGIDPIRIIREQRKRKIVEILGNKCQICGYNKSIRNLAFHHLYDKKFSVSSRAFQFSILTVLNEISKCILVCHNCHGEIHDGLIDNQLIIDLNLFVVANLRTVSDL